MRKTALKRKSKTLAAKTKDRLWELCKLITRARYIQSDGTYRCFTCDKLVEIPHTGHFIPDAACGVYLRYDLRNLRLQCFHCNINLGGNGAEFYRRMVKEVGQKAVNQLFTDKQKIVKATDHINRLLNEYETIYEDIA